MSELSQREAEIARAYARGETYQTIAATLGIAPSTVRTHLATIYRKLEVSSKLELTPALTAAAPEPKPITPPSYPSLLSVSTTRCTANRR